MMLKRSPGLDIGLVAIFSVLLFISSIFVAYTSGYGAIIYSIFLLTGALVIGRPFSATLISTVAGLIHSFQSHFFLLILGTFLIRGLVVDLIFIPTKAYERARSENPGRSLMIISMISMTLSGLAAGAYHYFFLILFLKMSANVSSFVAITIFLTSIISNIIAPYIVVKYLLPRLRLYNWS